MKKEGSKDARLKPEEHPHEVRNPDIHLRRAERLKKLQGEQVQNLTVAQRLTRRALEREIPVPMTDSEGEFIIRLHVPTRDEYDKILSLLPAISSTGGAIVEGKADAVDAFYQMLGMLCVDESLNYEFWKEGAYDATDLILIFTKLVEDLAKLVGEARTFRAH